MLHTGDTGSISKGNTIANYAANKSRLTHLLSPSSFVVMPPVSDINIFYNHPAAKQKC